MKNVFSSLAVVLSAFTATSFGQDYLVHMIEDRAGVNSWKPKAGDSRGRSPDIAKLLLERRLGWPESSALVGKVDDETIRELNLFGGQQALPFTDTDREQAYKLLLILEGVDSEEIKMLETESPRDFAISNPPPFYLDDSILSSFMSESSQDDRSPNVCLYGEEEPSCTGFIALRSRETPLLQNGELGSLFKALATLSSDSNVESTVITVPYDTYTKNKGQKRSPADKAKPKVHKVRSPSANQAARADATSASTAIPANPTAPFHLPVCYTKNETCTERTNSCSGHGSCYLKRTSTKNSTSSSHENDCYACKCHRTVVSTNKDGKTKTVQWGGPDCSKRDVSMQFWLIGGLSLLLVLGVGYGIGMLFSIGEEELPVISYSITTPTMAPPLFRADINIHFTALLLTFQYKFQNMRIN
ncbi:conserved hypothetical protein [Microsporum canis CBS 113480]|uniref:Vacuolar sorting protein Vps3844 C-terminal domain-containing protein n=1 Tax=Arthroderma otae (strain ATCC MYA-4605 / CBS 113480) TaxID=554155 RepID=C5FXA1_ARTOC|nr:conserved hypothetical protein [Microsporum canis CBS 113480]EEQ34941.1 conserved hypothetical protein [Microsporum canis CBS 113480]